MLILQHPQEPDKLLGSAKLTNLSLENSTLKIGLSWANLSKALGRPVEHAKWGVLFLGGKAKPTAPNQKPPRLQALSKSGNPVDLDETPLEGIVLIDGTWAQAKTMWWRNPWMIKLKRLVVTPQQRSLYGDLRREPRRECLSTIEAAAETLEALGESPDISVTLREHFKKLLDLYRKSPLREKGPSARR